MRIKKALVIVLNRWGISRYRLSKASGIPQSALSRIVNDDGEHFAWPTIEKIALGLEVIDPVARLTFEGLVFKPDDFASDPQAAPVAYNHEDIKELCLEFFRIHPDYAAAIIKGEDGRDPIQELEKYVNEKTGTDWQVK